MSTKTSIIAKIQSLLTGNTDKTTWNDHEEILYNSADSILESVYSDVIIDDETTTNVFTPVATNAEYKIKINKQANKVTLNIAVECTSGYIGGTIAEITNSEFLPDEDVFDFDEMFSATGSIYEFFTDTGDTLTASIRRDNFSIVGYTLSFTSNSNVLFNGQTFRGQLTYFTKD